MKKQIKVYAIVAKANELRGDNTIFTTEALVMLAQQKPDMLTYNEETGELLATMNVDFEGDEETVWGMKVIAINDKA